MPNNCRMINMSPDTELCCPVPVDWFIEFLQMQDGETIEKTGFAWFYEPPDNRDECVYSASLHDDVLTVVVEVGREAVRRRVAFPIGQHDCTDWATDEQRVSQNGEKS